jgi:putative hemolysin
MNLRQSVMREAATNGNKGAARALWLNENLDTLTVSYELILISLHLAAAALVIIGVVPHLDAELDELSAEIVSIIALFALALILIFLGYLVPASIGQNRGDQLSPWLSFPMWLLVILLSPIVKLVMILSRLVAGLFGSSELVTTVTEEEIMTLLDAGQKEGTIEIEEKAMIYSILHFADTQASDVMVPRIDLAAVEINTPLEDALAKFVESGHSRIPVYEDRIDNITGMLYAKDLLTLWHNGGPKPSSVRELIRPAYFVPEVKQADSLLSEMKKSKIHVAVVVDEYGGTAGLVTIEDLIEEIVGEIQDEYDLDEEAAFVEKAPGEYLIDGSMDLDDVNDLLNTKLPTEDNNTLGGYIYSEIGRVPERGEVITDEVHGLVLRVEAIDGQRIRKVHVTVKTPEDPENPEGNGGENGNGKTNDKASDS